MNTLETSTPPSVPSTEPNLSSKRQITLRGLFLCTTYFAISSALALRFGAGIFVLMNGIFLAWLSFRGYLWWLQTNHVRPRVYGVGWLLFAISFGLPALTVQGCGNGPPQTYYGWQAAVSTVIAVQTAGEELQLIAQQPELQTWKKAGEFILTTMMIGLWNLPNLLMLASPFILLRQQRGKGTLLSALINCAAISSWMWGVTGGEDLRIGYYVWSTGITIISLARPIGWRSGLAMAAVGLFWLLVAFGIG